jgi:hypothetical protein
MELKKLFKRLVAKMDANKKEMMAAQEDFLARLE